MEAVVATAAQRGLPTRRCRALSASAPGNETHPEPLRGPETAALQFFGHIHGGHGVTASDELPDTLFQ
jgi:hypothetical protein